MDWLLSRKKENKKEKRREKKKIKWKKCLGGGHVTVVVLLESK